MLGLPKSTEFNKRIPKQKFYENMTLTPQIKRIFVEQIKGIYWRNKLAASTVNIAAGETINELEVFEIALNRQGLDEAVMKQIDKEIPYHILFVLTCEDKAQAWIGYKEAAKSGNHAFKVSAYYHTPWVAAEQLSLSLDGLSMDAVYESLVQQIAGDALQKGSSEDLKASVEKAEKKKRLEAKIAALKAKIKKEKQLNKQVELNCELKRLKKELEEHTNG